MAYIILSNLPVVFSFIYPIIERFKKIFMHCLAMSSIVIYYTTIIPNILNKVINCIKLKIVKDWLT